MDSKIIKEIESEIISTIKNNWDIKDLRKKFHKKYTNQKNDIDNIFLFYPTDSEITKKYGYIFKIYFWISILILLSTIFNIINFYSYIYAPSVLIIWTIIILFLLYFIFLIYNYNKNGFFWLVWLLLLSILWHSTFEELLLLYYYIPIYFYFFMVLFSLFIIIKFYNKEYS